MRPATLPSLLDRLLPTVESKAGASSDLRSLLAANGFDRAQHEQIRSELRDGRIGLAFNRFPSTTQVEDVAPGDLFDLARDGDTYRAAGEAALARGELAVINLRRRSGQPLDSRRRAPLPHVFTTSYLTHAPTEAYLRRIAGEGWERDVWLSPGRTIGLRLVPTVRDLQFAWEEIAQQKLDEQKEKMRDSVRAALTNWARTTGEASDYIGNLPGQCLHPVGHWFEIPNLLKNGPLAALIQQQPNLRTLMVHNIGYPRGHRRPRHAGLVQPHRCHPRLGSHHQTDRRPRRGRRPHQRLPAPRRGTRAASRRRRISPDLLQRRHLLDRYRPAPLHLRSLAPGPVRLRPSQ
ncbi:MAG: hypothetical protein J6386_14250 [Candidatus Synoicihabitans palmerolidicus]|nr:hypothetical protein [Candidatus Synoicihabitans palmerolidicus]